MEASKADLEWSARIDQALNEYPEMREYLDAIRGNIEALAARLAAVRELADMWASTGEPATKERQAALKGAARRLHHALDK